MSNTNREETKMNKSEAAQQLEAQIREASLAVDKTNTAHGPVRLDHFAILEGTFEDDLATARQFLKTRLAEVLQAQDHLDRLSNRVTEGAARYYAAEIQAMYSVA